MASKMLLSERIPTAPPTIEAVSDQEKRPLWSVMIPTYNCTAYLKYTLESVLAQAPDADAMQIEVVDDYSTDGDVAALVQAVGKGRIQYFRQPQNRGSLRNFETCINRAKGEWVHILHGDDIVRPGFYAEIEGLFTKHPEAGAAFTNNSFINEKGELMFEKVPVVPSSGVIQDFLLKSAEYQRLEPPAIVVKRKVYEQLGSFFAVHYGEDWEMWTRISAHFPIAYSPKCLAAYRALENTNITSKSFQSGQNVTDLLKVIDIIQAYLPAELKEKYKRLSLKHYSIYNARVANGIYYSNTQAAFRQIDGALGMDKNLKTILLACKLYFKYIFRFKQVRGWLHSKK